MNTDSIQTSFLEKLNSRNNYDLFGSDITEDFHWGKLFVHLYGEHFSRYKIYHKVKNAELINAIIQRYSLSQNQILRIDSAKDDNFFIVDYGWSEVLLILKERLFFGIYGDRINIMYGSSISLAERDELIKLVDEFKVTHMDIRPFYMIQYSRKSFDLTEFSVKPFDFRIETHYNDDFQSINDLIFDSLRAKRKNGLVLLHGKYGSGKTYYLRHLISNIERKFIYFPLNMIDSINSPEFLPFISEHPNSILILEDCESLLVHRENGLNNASALSNLLNLGDGLLSDALSVNVICTFNAGIKKIDDAILRKGRLLARYEFKELDLSKAQALAHQIGKKVIIDHPMTVSDIYNLDDQSFENAPSKTVGFKAA